MTIFKQKLDEEYITVSEAKEALATVEADRAAAERDLEYELARAIEHANRFAVLTPEESRALVDSLLELDYVEEATAYKVTDLLPESRDELRAVYAQERYSLEGSELDEILGRIAEYA